jgi:predicted restriction endonuclease
MRIVFADGKNVTYINQKGFTVEDTLEYITLADSFLLNKIGSGHGEAKLYVGQENNVAPFFEGLEDQNCFFLKKDFFSFLIDSKSEYNNPQQNYQKKSEMGLIYLRNFTEVSDLSNEELFFSINRVNVEPPRYYINSDSHVYELLRKIGLPNISYLSILKLRNILTRKMFFYFRIFIDYRNDLPQYISSDEKSELIKIEKSSISQKLKQSLTNARIGQGEYREKLLNECPFCPFTMVNDERLLTASHIKPWRSSKDEEKIDPKNGFIFTPTFDRLFDRGFISFENDKTLMVSPWISPMNQKRLDIYSGKLIENLSNDNKRLEYLEYHRKFIFKN